MGELISRENDSKKSFEKDFEIGKLKILLETKEGIRS